MDVEKWYPFAAGSTIGETGSEDGVILLDEEYSGGARITLERDGSHAPFAITCGIYGWMAHTRYFATEQEAHEEFEAMKAELARIADLIPMQDDPQVDKRADEVVREIEAFVRENFP